MPLKPKFNKFTTASPVIASYNFEDIISGTGIIFLYAGNVNNGGTADYLLSNFQYYSDTASSSTGALGAIGSTKKLDLDFDVLINSPIELEGEAIVNVPITAYAAGDGIVSVFAIVKLRKVNDAGETEIANVTMRGIVNWQTNDTSTYGLFGSSITVPKTRYVTGDILRVTVELWCAASGNTLCSAGLINDPKGRTVGTAESSQLTIQLPVRLDL